MKTFFYRVPLCTVTGKRVRRGIPGGDSSPYSIFNNPYVTPQTEVVELVHSDVLCASGNTEPLSRDDFGWGSGSPTEPLVGDTFEW